MGDVAHMNFLFKWYAGKTALITGATSGIGRDMAKLLVQCGCRVVLCGRDPSAMQSLRKELSSSKDLVVYEFIGDLSREEIVQKLIQDVRQQEITLDILINNAGLGNMEDFVDIPKDKMRAMEELNIGAVVVLCREFLPDFIKRSFDGSGILNVGSVASFFPVPGAALYSATKYFILGFTDALHQEVLADGIHVTGLYPGRTHTHFASRASQGKIQKWEKAMPSDVVAFEALKGLMENKIRVIPGIENQFKVFLSRLLPVSLIMKKAYTNRSSHRSQTIEK